MCELKDKMTLATLAWTHACTERTGVGGGWWEAENGRDRPPLLGFSHCHGNPSGSPVEMKLLAPWLKPPGSCNVGERALNRQPGRPGLSSGFATWQSPSAGNSTPASWLLGLKSLALSSAPLSLSPPAPNHQGILALLPRKFFQNLTILLPPR